MPTIVHWNHQVGGEREPVDEKKQARGGGVGKKNKGTGGKKKGNLRKKIKYRRKNKKKIN